VGLDARLKALESERATFQVQRDDLLTALSVIEARQRARAAGQRKAAQDAPGATNGHQGMVRPLDPLDRALLSRKGF